MSRQNKNENSFHTESNNVTYKTEVFMRIYCLMKVLHNAISYSYDTITEQVINLKLLSLLLIS